MVTEGLAANSRRTYSRGVDKYIEFCTFYRLNPLILSEWNTLRFITHLVDVGMAPSTIKVYMAGLRAWLINQGAQDVSLYTQKVKWALKSAERRAPVPIQAKPIDYSMLLRIYRFIPLSYFNMVGFTAMLVGYFGCLRAAEYLPDPGQAPPIYPKDLTIVLDVDPPYAVLLISTSKTAPKGFKVVLGCTYTKVCSVCWLSHLLRVRPFNPQAPIFAIARNQVLSRSQFSRFIRDSMMAASIDPSGYTPHSLRAGAATRAAIIGRPEADIQSLGRWRSSAYRAYIRPQDQWSATLSAELATAQGPN